MGLRQKLTIEELQKLVDELTKARPSQVIVKELFSKADIQYVKDPIAQLSLALAAIESFKFKKPKAEKVDQL